VACHIKLAASPAVNKTISHILLFQKPTITQDKHQESDTMSLLAAILTCLTGGARPSPAPTSIQAQHDPDRKQHDPQTDADLAASILSILRTAEKTGPSLHHRLKSAVGTRTWSETLARAVLDGVVELVQQGREKMGPAMAEAVARVEDEASDVFRFAKEHPEAVAGFVVIVAVGILVVMMAPWVVEALGFAELGPVEGLFCFFYPLRLPFGRFH
jgi:hypothetical protein